MAKNIDISKLQIKIDIDIETFYNIYNVLSYNAFINIVMGGRGIGKTTQFLIWAIKRRRDYGEEFIYLRRYKTETANQDKLLDKIVDGVTFKGNKNGGGTYYWNGNILGYCIALSTTHNFKSVNFDNVKYIIYDEAIIKQDPTNRYLKNEVDKLLEFLSTVFRLRTGVRCFVLGNNLDYFNPYCSYFNVELFNKLYYDKERSIFIEYAKDSVKLREMETNTPLYKLTKGTAYHDYHYNNEVLVKNKVEVSKKHDNDKLRIRINMNNYTLNIYIRANKKLYIECKKKIIQDEITYVLLKDNEINYYYANELKARWLKVLEYKYYNNEIEYNSQDAYNLFEMIIDMY